MKTAVASDDDKGPKKSFKKLGLSGKPERPGYGLKPEKKDKDRELGYFTKSPAKPKAKASPANPDKPKGPKIDNKMKVVPLKVKTMKDQEMEKAKAKEHVKNKNGKKK